MKKLSEALLMVCAILGFAQFDWGIKKITLKKKFAGGQTGPLDLVLSCNENDLSKPCSVSLTDMEKEREVFRTFDNTYDAIAYIQSKGIVDELYPAYKTIKNDSTEIEIQTFFAMVSDNKNTKFTKIHAVDKKSAMQLLEPAIIKLLGRDYNDGSTDIDIAIFTNDEATKFSGFVMGT